MMQTSANVSRPPLDAAWTCKDQPGENSQCASTASQRFTDGLVRLDCDCGCHRLQLNRYLADLAGELERHRVRPGHGCTFAQTDISALVRRKSYWAVSGHLCRCGLLRCDESHRQRSNSYLEERVREFPELVQSVRSLQPAQSPEVHALYAAFFLGSDRGCNCQK